MSNVYNRNECATFRKTKENLGGLSNMAAGYPIVIGPYTFKTSEHLYQAMRFSYHPTIQLEVNEPISPMASKMVAKKHISLTRPIWNYLRIDIMKWCLQVKLLQNESTFGTLLKSTGEIDIVEDSHKDEFWGAIPTKQDNNVLIGLNVLGELLRIVRNDYVKLGIEGISKDPNLSEEKLLFNNDDLVKLL